MPTIRPKKKEEKKKSFFDRLTDPIEGAAKSTGRFYKRAARDAEDIATGIPTGAVLLSHAIDSALPRSPIPGVDDNHKRDSRAIKAIGRQSILQMKEDLRHPLRNPVSTALTVAGLASLGTGTVARGSAGVGAISKGAGIKGAAKAAARPKPATRTLKAIQKPTPAVGNRYKSSGGKWVETSPQKSGRKEMKMVANNNPFIRGIRAITLDPLYEKSAAKAAKNLANPKLIEGAKILKHGSKEYEKIVGNATTPRGILRKVSGAGYHAVQRGQRIQPVSKAALHHKQPRGGTYAKFVERRTTEQRQRYSKQLSSATAPVVEKGIERNFVRDAYRAPLDLMRMSMYVRPRYLVQNLGGTAMLLAHMGIGAGDVRKVRQIAQSDPELYKMMIGAGGETGTSSISMSPGSSQLGKAQQKMASLANRPEAHMRTLAVYKAAKDFGIEDPAKLKKILKMPDSNEAQLIMQRANEAVVDYSRVGGKSAFGKAEASFVRSGIPIFYPMTKGFTRYAGRFPTEHPVQAGLMAALGQQGKEAQRQGIGGEPQPWFPYITPLEGGKTQNLQNIYAFSPGTDVIRQAAQALPGAQRHPTLNIAQQIGPTAELLYGALAGGRQLATGFEYDKDTLDAYGSALTALGDTLNSVIPGADLLFPRSSAAFGEPSWEDRFKLWLGGPGFVQRKTDMDEVVQPRKKKKRKRSGGSGY